MVHQSIDTILTLYFESRGQAVKERYLRRFFGIEGEENDDKEESGTVAPSDSETGDEEFSADRDDTESSECFDEASADSDEQAANADKEGEVDNDTSDQLALLDQYFVNCLQESHGSEDIKSLLLARWQDLGTYSRVCVSSYMDSIVRDNSFHRIHDINGLFFYFGLWNSSEFLHAYFPDLAFPYTGEISFLKLIGIFDQLGIEFIVDEDATEFDNWLDLGMAVAEWADNKDFEDWQAWAAIYDLGPRLVAELPPLPTDFRPRVWLIASNDQVGEFSILDARDPGEAGTWAINKKARRGDLALHYCVSPRSALIGVCRVLEDAHFDPFGGWNGYRANVELLTNIPWITIQEMRQDAVLKEWGVVRGRFQGLLRREVTEQVWKRFREIIAERDPVAGEKLAVFSEAAVGVRSYRAPNESWSEKEVEDRLIIPLLERLGWVPNKTLKQQVEMQIQVGSGRPQLAIADFVGYANQLTSDVCLVVEAKRRISTTAELDRAKAQAESYATKLKCDVFAVAAPEGVWVYEREISAESRLVCSSEVSVDGVDPASKSLEKHLSYAVLAGRQC